jgi:hypothetical protein
MKKILAMIMVAAMCLAIVNTSFAMPLTKKHGVTGKHPATAKTHKSTAAKGNKAVRKHKAKKHTASHTGKHSKKHVAKHTAKHKAHRKAKHVAKHAAKRTTAKPVAKKKK